MRHPRSPTGFTLIELLLTLTIASITFGMAAGGMTSLVEKSRKQALQAELLTLINLARNNAISNGVAVTLCPLDSRGHCSKNWSSEITVFRDPQRERRMTNTDQIIRISDPVSSGELKGRTGIRTYFGFRPSGLAREAIGHFLWCPDDDDAARAFQIRINMGGRPLVARDNNNDGVVEDAYGAAVSCS